MAETQVLLGLLKRENNCIFTVHTLWETLEVFKHNLVSQPIMFYPYIDLFKNFLVDPWYPVIFFGAVQFVLLFRFVPQIRAEALENMSRNQILKAE